MSSYDILVEAYDELFPLNAGMVHFVEQQFGGRVNGLHLLDAGCGTGSLAIALARHGAGIKAFDLNPGMVDKAEGKRPQALNLMFRVGSLLDMESLYPGQIFDGILCVGNTLVHLPDRVAIASFFDQALRLLKPGGKLVVQMVNYDNIMAHKPDSLPVINTKHYLFERGYEYTASGHVRFITSLSNMENGHSLKDSTLLLPCEKSFLENELEGRFRTVDFFGAFDGAPWHGTTFHTIVVAQK